MASVNKVILVGNLGRAPEVRNTTNGTLVATLNLATTEKYMDKNGNPQEQTEWHRIVQFGKQAEIAENYLHKGDAAYIEGRLQTKKWEDQTGQTRYTMEIVCDRMQMLGSASKERGIAAERPAYGRDNDLEVPWIPPPTPPSTTKPPFDDKDVPF